LIRDTRKILEVLSEETRYEIIKLLSSSTRLLTVNDLSERLNKDKKTIDKHLRILLEHGLVERKYLEDERSYGYTLTRLCSNIMIALEKATSMETFEIETPHIQTGELKIKKSKNFHGMILSSIFFILAIIIGYGDRIGFYPYNPDRTIIIAKTFGFIIFIILAIFFLYITFRKRIR